MSRMRRDLKTVLARTPDRVPTRGSTLLIYHRVGGGSGDELDVAHGDFEQQLDALTGHRVVSLDDAVAGLDDPGAAPSVVLTFDDGFRDVYDNAWPLLRERRLPFTLYLATAYLGGAMCWPGSTARDQAAAGLDWDQVAEMVASGLCTVGNHTHRHVGPEQLAERELDECSEAISTHLGVLPAHFAYPWGSAVPEMEPALRARFRSAATGEVGRNEPGTDPLRLRRVPVRGSDPLPFFRAKLTGSLAAERLYAATVSTAKRLRRHG